MKLFYFLDFTHLKTYGRPVTFDKYYHLEHGPIPTSIKNLVDSATDDIDNSVLADTFTIERPENFEMYRVLPSREFSERDKQYFSETELEILDRICARFKNTNTKEIEEAAHREAPYKNTSLLEEIPYSLAADDPDCRFTKEQIEFVVNL